MKREEFETLVEEGYLRLPDWVREKIKNVAILIEDQPSEEVRERECLGSDETLLGYYQRTPLSERGEMYGVGGTLPDTITIYMEPILEAARENVRVYETLTFEEVVAKEVADTVWHEFAHHFGMDEDEVQEREVQRNNE